MGGGFGRLYKRLLGLALMGLAYTCVEVYNGLCFRRDSTVTVAQHGVFQETQILEEEREKG